MRFVHVSFAGLIGSAIAYPGSQCTNGFKQNDIIKKDVAIIGGGATGTYSAVRLRDDIKKSVILIEKKDRLGGHTQTYVDPTTKIPVEYGVQAWHNLTAVNNFFARFNVPLAVAPNPPFQTQYIDLESGKPVAGYPSADPTQALLAYAAQVQKYSYLVGGYRLPDPVPADLLLPFGQFVAKYKLEAAVPVIFTFAVGLGDIVNAPTIYVMQNFGLVQLQSLQSGFLIAANHDNSEIYRKARQHLGSDVLLQSEVTQTCRDVGGYNYVVVQTPQGRKLIQAKKLLITIPPVANNIKPFDLDRTEKDVFNQLRASSYYTGLVRGTGIPDGVSIVNAGANTPLHLPKTPFVGNLDFTGVPGLHRFNYIDCYSQPTERQVKASITNSILSMKTAGTLATKSPQYAVFDSHTPLQIRVDADAIKRGFYNKMYALQGRHGTFYTGAAWAADDSSLLWQWSEGILSLVAA